MLQKVRSVCFTFYFMVLGTQDTSNKVSNGNVMPHSVHCPSGLVQSIETVVYKCQTENPLKT